MLPPEPSKTYIQKNGFEQHGPDLVRPNHLCYFPEAGNKGHVLRESFKNLVCLIMCRGFMTDPFLPGVEMLLVCKPDHRLFKESDLPRDCLGGDDARSTMPPFNVHMIKGWTRVAALHTLLLIMRQDECIHRWIEFLGPKALTLRTIHVNKLLIPDGQDQIDVNRGRFATSFTFFFSDCFLT